MTHAFATRLPRPHGFYRQLAMALVIPWALAGQAWADSVASSAASSVSNSVGSASESLGRSSNGSSKGTGVAQGPYTVEALLAVADRPDWVQVQLRAAAPHTALSDDAAQAPTLWVKLPRTTADQAQLAVGTQLMALNRPYGIALATSAATAPFFLVVDDAIHHELNSHPVGG